MTSETITACEGCGQEARSAVDSKPRGWIFSSFTINGQSDTHYIDVCSWACLARYGQKRDKESIGEWQSS